ncbi:uncharacterized protein BDV14DRAFT_123405 [Aspergillus stella-maris]|uniref:uncharacterized protein n=1 Tax=Aspergillus stella-maris TaxID=1810926 RepID=UPI003CCE2665
METSTSSFLSSDGFYPCACEVVLCTKALLGDIALAYTRPGRSKQGTKNISSKFAHVVLHRMRRQIIHSVRRFHFDKEGARHQIPKLEALGILDKLSTISAGFRVTDGDSDTYPLQMVSFISGGLSCEISTRRLQIESGQPFRRYGRGCCRPLFRALLQWGVWVVDI